MNPLLPLVAFAAETSPSIRHLMQRVSYYILNPLIKLGFVIALVYFLWGVFQFVNDRESGYVFGSSADSRRSGRKGMSDILWGLAGLLIMVSAFAIMQAIATFIGSDIKTP